jgi:hypothetical protein
VGALLTSIPAYIISTKTIAAEDNRSVTEFTRTQRQTVYAQFLSDSVAVRRLETDYFNTLSAKADSLPKGAKYVDLLQGNDKEITEKVDGFKQAMGKLSLTFGNVEVIGSTEAIDAARNELFVHGRVEDRLTGKYPRNNDLTIMDVYFKLADDSAPRRSDHQDPLYTFMTVAHRDLTGS